MKQYHLFPFPPYQTSSHHTSSRCLMNPTHHQQSWEVRRKHENAILHSMTQQQCRLTTPPMVLPSSNELWISLKTQLLVELQRMAKEHRMTLVEMREWMLTQPANLTEQERAWLEQTRRLISVMPPLPSPPKNLLQGVIPYPSTSMPLNLEAPSPPYMSTPSTESHLPTPNDLIRQILRMDRFPTPNFASQYPGV